MERFAINILHQKIQNICRLCGVDNPVKMPIVEDDDIICLDDDEVTLVKKIEECVGIKVYKTDQMPQQICSLCIDKVNDFYEYRLMCAATNVQTRTILNLPLVEPTSVLIKTEPEPEPAPPEETTVPLESKAGVKRGSKTRSRKNDNTDTGDLQGASSEKRIKTEYACQYCNEAYDASSDLERHLVVKHTPLIRKYGCGTCAELFDTAIEYKDHNLWHKLTRTPFRCCRCKRKFLKFNALDKHLEIHACVRNMRKPTTTTLVPDMQCKLCTKTFKTKNLYEWHSCFLRARANCPKCGKYFMKKNLLIRHYMLYCTGTLAPMEPVLVKEEPATLGTNGFPEPPLMPVKTGKPGKRRGRPRLTPRMEEMKEETSELPFPPLLDLPEMKLESSTSEAASGEANAATQDADLGSDNRKRSKVTFAEEAEKISTLLRSGAGVDENSHLNEISSMLTSVNEAIATISNVRKRKKHKAQVASKTIGSETGEDPAGTDTPMVVLSMANIMPASCTTPGTPQANIAPMHDSEQSDLNYTSTNKEAHEKMDGNASNAEDTCDGESTNDLEDDGFAGYDDTDDIDNMAAGGSDHEMEDSSSTVSTVHHEGVSPRPHEVDTQDGTQMAPPVLRVKQEPMAYHSNPEADDVGEYEMAMSCLAIKHEPVDQDNAQANFEAIEPTSRSERRTTQSTPSVQALRIKIKKEKGLHNATVVDEESGPIQTPAAPEVSPVSERSVARQQKKPTKKANAPTHYKVRPMRSRPTADAEPEVQIKQERLDQEQHGQGEEYENEEPLERVGEEYSSVAIKQEPVDCFAEHSNLDQSVPTRSSFELHADGSSEADTAFDGTQIKQERLEATTTSIWATASNIGATDEPLNAGGRLGQADGSLSIVNEAGSSRSGSKSKKSGAGSNKSSRRINPFALLKRKTLAAENAQEPASNEEPSGSSAARASLPIIAQVTSVDPEQHLAEAMDSSPFEAQVDNSTDGTSQSNDSDERGPDKESPPVPPIALSESSMANTETAAEKMPVENVITQRNATELRIIAVSTVQEPEALTEETGCVATEKADFCTESDPEAVENGITSKEKGSTMSVVDNESTECDADDKEVSGDDDSSKCFAEKMDTDTETILPKESNQEAYSDEEKSISSPQPEGGAPVIAEKQVQPLEADATKEINDEGGTSKILTSEEEAPTKVLPAQLTEETAEIAEKQGQEMEKDAAKEVKGKEEIFTLKPSEGVTKNLLPIQPAEESPEVADERVQAVVHDAAIEPTEKEEKSSNDVMDDGETSKVLIPEERTPKVLPAQPVEEIINTTEKQVQEVENDAATKSTEKEEKCSNVVLMDDEGTSKLLTSEESAPSVSTTADHVNSGNENEKT